MELGPRAERGTRKLKTLEATTQTQTFSLFSAVDAETLLVFITITSEDSLLRYVWYEAVKKRVIRVVFGSENGGRL